MILNLVPIALLNNNNGEIIDRRKVSGENTTCRWYREPGSMSRSHLFSSSFTGYQSNSASNLRSYCWYRRQSTDLYLSTSMSCLCFINPDAIFDQKQRAFCMSLGLKFGGHRAFSISAPRLWNALQQHLKDSTSCQAINKCLKTHLFRLAH